MTKINKEIYTFLQERNWLTDNAGNIAKSISIESAELLELFQWENPIFDDIKTDVKKFEAVKKELADVLIYAHQMAMYLDMDTEEIMREKLLAQAIKYPAEIMKKKGSEYYELRDAQRDK